MRTYINRKIIRWKQREQELLNEINSCVESDRREQKTLQKRIKGLSKSIRDNDAEAEADWAFLRRHQEMSQLIGSIAEWGSSTIKLNETNGSIEKRLECVQEPTTQDNVPESAEKRIRNKSYRVLVAWSKTPDAQRLLGVAITPWTDDRTGDHLIYISASDTGHVYAVERLACYIIWSIHEVTCISSSIVIFQKKVQEGPTIASRPDDLSPFNCVLSDRKGGLHLR